MKTESSALPTVRLQNSQRPNRCSPKFAAEKARLLFGCFRKGEANDPEIYVLAIIAILQEYSEEVVERVTSPLTGLPRRIDFLPTVREVDRACFEFAKACMDRDSLIGRGYTFDDEAKRWIRPKSA
jgi:hypothetical protein